MVRKPLRPGETPPVPSESEVVRYGFLLLPEFPMYALIPAIEALRIANQNRGRKLYSWHLFSTDGKPVRAGNGMTVPVEAAMPDISWFPTLFVCGGNHPTQYGTKRTLNWLRRLARHGAVLGAFDTGIFALAAAGLLKGYKVTCIGSPCHVSRPISRCRGQRAALCHRSRSHHLRRGNAASTSCHLIARRHGPALGQIVANGFVAQRMRRDAEPQRLSAQQPRRCPRAVDAILHEMEDNLETPSPRASSPTVPGSRCARWAASCATGSANRPCAII